MAQNLKVQGSNPGRVGYLYLYLHNIKQNVRNLKIFIVKVQIILKIYTVVICTHKINIIK